jgi:hypothetical protein
VNKELVKQGTMELTYAVYKGAPHAELATLTDALREAVIVDEEIPPEMMVENLSEIPRMDNCPFCGCQGAWVDEECEDEWKVKCSVCMAEGPKCDTRKLAIIRWNDLRDCTWKRR